MNILIVSQYFWPENFRINDLAVSLVKKGHKVTILTGIPNYPEGKTFSEFSLEPKRFANLDGVSVIRVPMITRGQSKLRLLINYVSFFISASTIGIYKLRNQKFDFSFVFEVSPVTVALPAIMMKKLRGFPSIMWVLDAWPDTLVDLKLIKPNSLTERMIKKLVAFIYKNMDVVFCQSPTMAASIKHNYTSIADKVDYLPNWAEDIYQVEVSPVPVMSEKQCCFKILFAGNMGQSQDFLSVLKTIEQIKQNRIHWFFLGGGRMVSWFKQQVESRDLASCVTFIDAVTLEDVPAFYAVADALLVTLGKGLTLSNTIPGKIQSYLASGKPILGMLDGDGKRVIDDSGSGLTADSGDFLNFAKQIELMSNMAVNERNVMGKNGKNYFEQNFSQKIVIDKILNTANTIGQRV